MNMSKKDVEQALAKELSELSEKQSETRQTATYIPVPQEEWEAYDKRC